MQRLFKLHALANAQNLSHTQLYTYDVKFLNNHILLKTFQIVQVCTVLKVRNSHELFFFSFSYREKNNKKKQKDNFRLITMTF